MKRRFDRSASALAAAVLLAYASVSEAQTSGATATGATGTPSAGAAANREASRASLQDVRMSDLVGMNVRNPKGESLGEVEDLVVDVESGRVAYAVVGIGGFLGIGEKLSAFPMSAFRLVPAGAGTTAATGGRVLDNDGVKGDRGPIGSDRTAAERNAQGRAGPIDNDGVKGDKGPIGSDRPGATGAAALPGSGARTVHAVLDADPQRLKRAPNFDRDKWPDWNEAKFRGEVDRAAGATAGTRSGRLVRASELLDADIRDAQRKEVGEIEDLVVDTRSGRVRYAVVDFDRAWTPNDKLVALPMAALRSGTGKGELTFSGDRAQLERAPAFDKDRWPNLNDARYRGEVDRYVSGWRTSSTDRGSGAASGARSGAAAAGTTGAAAGSSAPGTASR